MKIPLPDKLLILFTRNSFKHGMLFLLAGLFYGPGLMSQTNSISQSGAVFLIISLICIVVAAYYLAKSIRTSARIVRVLRNCHVAQASLREAPELQDEFDALPKAIIRLSYQQNQREYAKTFFTTEPTRYNSKEPVLVCNNQPDEFLMVKFLPPTIAQKVAPQQA